LKPREKLGADLDHVAVTQDVDFNEYQSMDGRQSDDAPSGTSPPGVLVVAHATLHGYEDRHYLVCVTVMDADTMWTIPPPAGEVSLASCELKSPHASEEGVIWHCWITAPKAGAHYIVRAKLYDSGKTEDLSRPTDESQLLDFMDTGVLTSAYN
jgi:hypothetical protein